MAFRVRAIRGEPRASFSVIQDFGYSTYNYGTGQFTTITPNGGGGYNTYTYPRTR